MTCSAKGAGDRAAAVDAGSACSAPARQPDPSPSSRSPTLTSTAMRVSISLYFLEPDARCGVSMPSRTWHATAVPTPGGRVNGPLQRTGVTDSGGRAHRGRQRRLSPRQRRGKLEAPPGFEPGMEVLQTSALPLGDGAVRTAARAAPEDRRWSGKRDSNPRLRPWQGRTLPLSYSRSPRTLPLKVPQGAAGLQGAPARVQRPGQPPPNAFRTSVTSGGPPAPACMATTSKRHGRAAHLTRAM